MFQKIPKLPEITGFTSNELEKTIYYTEKEATHNFLMLFLDSVLFLLDIKHQINNIKLVFNEILATQIKLAIIIYNKIIAYIPNLLMADIELAKFKYEYIQYFEDKILSREWDELMEELSILQGYSILSKFKQVLDGDPKEIITKLVKLFKNKIRQIVDMESVSKFNYDRNIARLTTDPPDEYYGDNDKQVYRNIGQNRTQSLPINSKVEPNNLQRSASLPLAFDTNATLELPFRAESINSNELENFQSPSSGLGVVNNDGTPVEPPLEGRLINPRTQLPPISQQDMTAINEARLQDGKKNLQPVPPRTAFEDLSTKQPQSQIANSTNQLPFSRNYQSPSNGVDLVPNQPSSNTSRQNSSIPEVEDFDKKYLKYKNKYLRLKENLGK